MPNGSLFSNVVIDLRDGGDWSLDLCFAGLVKNLGHWAVVDIPTKDKHREWGRHVDLNTPSDWGLERRTLGHTDVSHRLYYRSADTPGLARHLARVDRIWLDERMESFQAYRQMGFDKLPRHKVVVVAGHDRFWNQSPSFVASLYGDRLEAMLLDNWYPEYANLPFRTRRIGWSCNFDHYWKRPEVAPEKDIDISFVGYNSHPDRARFVDFIDKEFPDLKKHIVLEREPDSFGKFVSKAEYFDIIQRSKICLNLRGAADRGKTMRAYEIPYVGSFMLSQEIDDPGMRKDFENGVHCEYFKDESDLRFLIKHNLKWEFDREYVAAEGHRHTIHNLSVQARWAEVLSWLGSSNV